MAMSKTMTECYLTTDCVQSDSANEMNTNKLLPYLVKHVEGFVDDGSLSAIPLKPGHGYVNPPYLVKNKTQQYMLRKSKKNIFKIYSSCQTDDDELLFKNSYNFLSILHDQTDIPVPKMFCLCQDPSIIGSSFYIMEFIQGRVFKNQHGNFLSFSQKDRNEIYNEVASVLATIHNVDHQKLNLERYSKVSGFSQELTSSKVIEFFDETVHKASQNEGDEMYVHFKDKIEEFRNKINKYQNNINNTNYNDKVRTLVHGDIHFENVIFHETENRIIAVIDWEFCCIGDPMFDLTYFAKAFRNGYIPNEMSFERRSMPAWYTEVNAIGIPTETQFVQKYIDSLWSKEYGNMVIKEGYIDNINKHYMFWISIQYYRMLGIFLDIFAVDPDGEETLIDDDDDFPPSITMECHTVVGLNVLNTPSIMHIKTKKSLIISTNESKQSEIDECANVVSAVDGNRLSSVKKFENTRKQSSKISSILDKWNKQQTAIETRRSKKEIPPNKVNNNDKSVISKPKDSENTNTNSNTNSNSNAFITTELQSKMLDFERKNGTLNDENESLKREIGTLKQTNALLEQRNKTNDDYILVLKSRIEIQNKELNELISKDELKQKEIDALNGKTSPSATVPIQ